MSLNVVILAAGQGKRMHSQLPKVLHKLAGKTLITHVIEAARALDASRVCVVYGHGGERVRDALLNANVDLVRQDPQLGTAHAVQQALPKLGDAAVTLVLYGDVPLVQPETLRQLVTAGERGLAVLTAVLDDPTGYGRILRDARGGIERIVEQKDATDDEGRVREINTGFMALPTARISGWLARVENSNAQKEYYLTDVVRLALDDRVPVETVVAPRSWEVLGVNTRAQLAELERIYQRERANALLEQGVTLADPQRFDVRGSLTCGRDVEIDVNCVFEGTVRLDDAVSIGPNCVLKNVAVGAKTRIEAFSHMEDASIGEDCRIGPYARIRPGTRLENEVHIGNFVEVKASAIASGSKANHLAYIGDSEVGRNVNVGAGTITCNYDGANKHRTIIEDDVFIGSDTQLVAPVTVRRGATIAAGTTVTREVAAGELALSRVKQTAIAGWKRPRKKRES
jgi:bifunctional UDP-N-acetylglucosamine pyrophosphorylase/glucosamine-1-phosphate N-acetyltransferase